MHLHLVGIGGIGMSGIAEVLLSLGHQVSGSDIRESERTQYLRSLGVCVFLGHREENVTGASCVVYTSAITRDNVELAAARERGIPAMQRTQMLADLMRLKKGVSVAGTHGKTTTTGILATIMAEKGLDPTYIIGGRALNLKRHAKMGHGEHLVVEADESDGSFLLLNPIYSVVTNIDNDHMDFYKSEKALLKAFEDYLNRVPFYGLMALNAHDDNICRMIPRIKKRWVFYGIAEDGGLSPQNLALYASHICHDDKGSSFDISTHGRPLGRAKINIPGTHNVLNALGAATISYFMGIGVHSILRGLTLFKGMERRFERVFKEQAFEIFDDYGHHPTEIRATLKTFRTMRLEKRRIAIFEPHRFTRTKDHWDDFIYCFDGIDELHILDIYPASESPIEGIDSVCLVQGHAREDTFPRSLLSY